MSYTKLFSSIVTSTIWTESADICKVWVTMLAIANKHGEVQASIPGLAQIAGMPLPVVIVAIEKFLAPDQYSRTADDEGRRIEPIDGGWILLNHSKYRAMASKDEEKSASAKRQAAFRERQRRNEKVTPCNGGVTPCNDAVTGNRDIAEAEAEADTDTKAVKTKRVAAAPFRFSKPSSDDVATYGATLSPPFLKAVEFVDFYESKGWRVGNTPMKDWQATVRNWHRKDSSPPAPKTYSHANGYNESTSLDHL